MEPVNLKLFSISGLDMELDYVMFIPHVRTQTWTKPRLRLELTWP